MACAARRAASPYRPRLWISKQKSVLMTPLRQLPGEAFRHRRAIPPGADGDRLVGQVAEFGQTRARDFSFKFRHSGRGVWLSLESLTERHPFLLKEKATT